MFEAGFAGAGAGGGSAYDANGGVGFAANGEIEANLRFEHALRDDGRDEVAVVVARDRAVEREGNGVDDAGLTGASRAGEHEEIRIAEVDDGALAEGCEAADLKSRRPQGLPPAVR